VSLRFALALAALLAAPALAAAQDVPPSMISFGTIEKYASIYGKGGPKSERFTMEGRIAFLGSGRTLFGSGYAGTCSGLPAEHGDTKTPRFLYRIGEDVSLDYTCKYSIWMVRATMKSTSSYANGILTLKASGDFKRPDGKFFGRTEEEAEIDLNGGKCVVKKYRRHETESRQEEYSSNRDVLTTAAPNRPCYRMK
jgi:hypothetical protein